MTKLIRDFFLRDSLDVAPELLGCSLFRNENKFRKYTITEVEVYRGEEDLACHASKGRTARTEIMYNKGGYIYVYLIYGLYWMLNIVTGNLNQPQAILIRAVANCAGPGRVGRLLNIDKTFYGEDITNSNRIWIEKDFVDLAGKIETSPRIGIDYAGEKWKNMPWRFVLQQ